MHTKYFFKKTFFGLNIIEFDKRNNSLIPVWKNKEVFFHYIDKNKNYSITMLKELHWIPLKVEDKIIDIFKITSEFPSMNSLELSKSNGSYYLKYNKQAGSRA